MSGQRKRWVPPVPPAMTSAAPTTGIADPGAGIGDSLLSAKSP
ncbi:hypothetical protein BC477_14490 [Clavibacter michiganensis subsp. michiganensis]|nr:hypothetical protein BC477_14490 [Clavibacter michiganensis subsp. michiganensis]